MTIKEVLIDFRTRNKLSPLDTEILLSLATKKAREYILAHPEKELTKSQLLKFASFVKRRISGEPIAYITGKKEFFGLEFKVNKNVLIPRPETELLIEIILKEISYSKFETPDSIIDVGTGSGNIIISINKNLSRKLRTKSKFFAIDVSSTALRVAKRNAMKHRVNKKITLIHSDLLNYFLKNKISLDNIYIVANLPYVSSEIYMKHNDNLKYEPRNALISKNKGLFLYIKLLKQLKKISNYHTLHIKCFIEFSPEQKVELSRIIKEMLPKAKTKFFKDLAGRWRAAEISIAS